MGKLSSSDTLGWAISSVGLSEQYTEWSCSILKFKVDDSKVKSETLIIDDLNMMVTGDLSINLSDETLDMKIWTDQKNTIWINLRPVKISGPIRDPQINVIAVGTSNAARTYSELILAPQIFIPLRALGYLNTQIQQLGSNDDDPCQKLEKKLLNNKK